MSAHVNRNVKTGYAPPSPKTLQYSGHGITPAQATALQKSTRALILDFAHPRTNVWIGLRNAARLVDEIATKTNGLVWDEETREIFTPEAWRQRRLAQSTQEIPRVSNQTAIHFYNTGHSLRSITLGMAKMGLPDLIVDDMSESSTNQIGNLINLVSQALAEGEPIPTSQQFRIVLAQIRNADMRDEMLKSLKANAAGDGCLTLIPGKWEQGDPHNKLIQLTFEKYPGNDVSAKQERMLASFFGWEDHAFHIHHNAELLAASAQAKQQLPALQKAFAAGFQPGEYLEVKAPFITESGGHEWMWVEVRTWQGNSITGFLDNEPEDVPSLHSGQEVTVRQEDVFDFLHTFPDKRTQGNQTSEIIHSMQEAADNPTTSNSKPVVPPCDGN